ISVKVEELNNWYYLTHSGGTLFRSVRFLIPRLEGNTFQHGDKELSVGQVIKISQSSHNALEKDTVARVASLRKEEASPARFLVTFDGIPGSFPLLNGGGNFTFKWETYICEITETKITLGRNTLDLTWGHHLLPLKRESGLTVGHLYQVLAIVPNDKPGHHPFDCDLIFKYGNAPVPLIWKSKWMLTNNTIQVATDTFTLGDTTLCRGQTLRYGGPDTEFLKTDTDLKVLGFVRSSYPDFMEVVFENGFSALLCEEIVGHYYQWFVQGSFRNILGLPSVQAILGSITDRTGGRFSQNDFVVLADADGLRDNKQFSGQVCVVKGVYEPWGREQELRVIFLSDPQQEIRSFRASRFKNLKMFAVQKRFSIPLRRSAGKNDLNHPDALAYYLAGPPKGKLEAGKDCNGHVICVGDIVKPVRRGSYNMSSPLDQDGIHKNFLVIGRGRLGGDGDFFLYLLAKEDLTPGVTTNVYGLDELPAIYKTTEMMRCIALHMSVDCEYVDWKSEPTTFLPGQHVRVKMEAVPHYGLGKVQMGEIGQVTACMEEDVQVCFKEESEWIGLAEELEFLPVLGDRVSLNTSTPRYLTGSVSLKAVGVIRKTVSEESDLFLVDFPDHEGFYAYLDELMTA
ncbi:MAG: hypothetical protein UX45_C0027G0011, partial [Candidatus Uhrbacteria bacterium GW2011_GWF2_46_218]